MSRPSASGIVLLPEDKFPDQLEEYRTFTEQQIQVLCTEITQLMENSVIKNTSRTESKVFFSKLCGDYYRYCSEVIHDKNIRVNYEKKCFEVRHRMKWKGRSDRGQKVAP